MFKVILLVIQLRVSLNINRDVGKFVLFVVINLKSANNFLLN